MRPERTAPFFSVVIPAFNREETVLRAIYSVLGQDEAEFELVIVNDGSTDQTLPVVTDIKDSRVKVVDLAENRGVCPARNAGVDASTGQWVVFLDSDDELVPGALTLLKRRISEGPADVQRIASGYRWDDGSTSPLPLPDRPVLDYAGYLQWSEGCIRSDFHNTILRSTFTKVRLPDSRAFETIYHLDFACQFRTWFQADVIALEHQDARNRTANLDPKSKQTMLLRIAPDALATQAEILDRHGVALRRYAPGLWRIQHEMAVLFALLAGERRKALQYAWMASQACGLSVKVVGALVVGLVAPNVLARLQASR